MQNYTHRMRLSPVAGAFLLGLAVFLTTTSARVPTIGGDHSVVGGLMLEGAWNQWGGEQVPGWPKPIPLSARNEAIVKERPPSSRAGFQRATDHDEPSAARLAFHPRP